jgi:segregation and condensation protein B
MRLVTENFATHPFVTTKAFLAHFGFDTLRDLPDLEKLEDAGLLNKEKLLADIPGALGVASDELENHPL